MKTYTVKFVYHGKLDSLSMSEKAKIEETYFHLHNLFTNTVNPLYASWNKEYDIQSCVEYNHFIKEKQQAIADLINSLIMVSAEKAKMDVNDLCYLDIGDEANDVLYIPKYGNFESGDYVEFFLV